MTKHAEKFACKKWFSRQFSQKQRKNIKLEKNEAPETHAKNEKKRRKNDNKVTLLVNIFMLFGF